MSLLLLLLLLLSPGTAQAHSGMNLLDAIYTSSRRRRRIYILSAAEAVASRWLIYRDDILHIVHSNTQPRKPFDSSLDSFISPKSEFCYR